MGRQHYSPVELEVGGFCQPQPAQLDCLSGRKPTSQVQERSQRQTLCRRGEEKGQLHSFDSGVQKERAQLTKDTQEAQRELPRKGTPRRDRL